jgi:L-arabinose isomerase
MTSKFILNFGQQKAMTTLGERMPRPRIGILPTGHKFYWDQFPNLKQMGEQMYGELRSHLSTLGELVAPELVDTPEKAAAAARFFNLNDIDILLIFPFGYTTGMCVAPVARSVAVPIRLLNAHEDSSYEYKTADTALYLHHEGVCCIPEYAGTLVELGKAFKVRTGHFKDPRFWNEVKADCVGAAAARAFKSLNFGVIGKTYDNMTDMPFDEHRLLKTTGRLLDRPEVEEIENAFGRVSNEQLDDMFDQLREMYDVDETVTNDHLRFSAQVSVAFDEVVRRHNISAFGYYWWGEREFVTQLRSQSALAVSRLTALGRPGVTEGDVKTAMAMKIMDLLGAGGMFVEFFSMDFDEGFFLLGHDGPSNINVADGRAKLQHLNQHHGKTGHGLGIDFRLPKGPVTLLNLTQFKAGLTFKLIYTVGEAIEGEILNIGNPNCRVRVAKPMHEFMDAWCQQGPSHHIALGLGDRSHELRTFADAIGFDCVEI